MKIRILYKRDLNFNTQLPKTNKQIRQQYQPTKGESSKNSKEYRKSKVLNLHFSHM